VQSIKSHLASATFSRTTIFGRRWQLEDMIAAYLRQIRAASAIDLGSHAVVGRPVRYWGAEEAADDERAVARMREALGKGRLRRRDVRVRAGRGGSAVRGRGSPARS